MAVNTRGVFSLEKIREKEIFDEWVNLDDVWLLNELPNTGYFGGGGTPGSITYSRTDKLTYSTDTTVFTPGANLSVARRTAGATGDGKNGYFGGGYDGSAPVSIMDKLTYSTDTTVATPSANLSSNRDTPDATGNSEAGYFGGGFPGPVSTMDKLTYSTDTTAATPGANLSVARFNVYATGNSEAGYFGGGRGTGFPSFPIYSTMDKLTYSTDTTVYTPSANLSAGRFNGCATGNSTAGYFGGGRESAFPSPTPRSRMDKLTYSTDTIVYTPSANLSAARQAFDATGNSTDGYFGGGFQFPGNIIHSRTDKLTYSTDTTVFTPSANLSAARYDAGATSARANAMTLITRFSDGAQGTPPAPTPTSVTSLASAPTPNTGYFGGGGAPGSITYSTMDKLTYSTDTTVFTPSANLSGVRRNVGATGNSTSGYFGGGYNGSAPVSIMDKLTYSTDTTVATPSANLSSNRDSAAATGNSEAGYFGGGNPNFVSTMDKLTYSTDTTVYTPGADLSVARTGVSATGNSEAGYFGGGRGPGSPSFPIYSTMDKLTYSTDTTTYTPSANLSASRYGLAATGNSEAGYFGGGRESAFPFPTSRSRMDKLTYSTDTTVYTPGANLSVARNSLDATGNSTDGYFGGGFQAPGFIVHSTMDKLTYSTDTTVYTPSANLSAARYSAAATSARANALPSTAPIPVFNIV